MAAPKVSVMPSYTQLSIYGNAEVGEPITVWGRAFDGVAPYTYTLEFGDGSPVENGAVTDPDEISAVHTYATGGLKTFTLTVTDSNNETASRSGVIRAVLDPTHEQRVNMAVSKAKLFLYRTRIEVSDSGNDLVQWHGRAAGASRTDYSMGASASVILAFEQLGHLPANDRELDIYSDMVEKGLEWLTYAGATTTISIQTYGDPDGNGNGKGVLLYTGSSHQTYANAWVGLALVASEKGIAGAQARTVQAGPLAGRTYYSLVEDLMDQFAYCQSDQATWGGWQYSMNTSSSTSGFDGSSTQWIAFFLESARDLWAIEPPAWVVERMCQGYFSQRQAASGGIAYSSPTNAINAAKTGGALGAFKLGGYTLATDTAATNVARAVGFIGDYYTSRYRWLSSNEDGGVFGAWYATYSVKRGMVLQEIDRLDTVIGERDWQTDIDLWLLGDAAQLPATINPGQQDLGHMFGQQADGSWTDSVEYPGALFNGNEDMNTAMGVLMLTRSLPRPRPVSIITPVGLQSNKPLARAFQMTGEESYHLDPNASIIEYLWDFNDSNGLDWDNPDASGVNATNPGYDTVGTYVVTLRVKDSGDPAFFDTYTIEVEVVDTDVPPVAVPIPNGVYSGRVNQPITLDGSSSYDADGDAIVLYSWDTDSDGTFGDAFGVNPSVTYTEEYVGEVGLQVTAAGGVTSVNNAVADIIVSGTDLSVQSFFASNIDPNVEADLQVTIKSDDLSTNDYTGVQLKFYNGAPLNGGIQVGIPYTFDILKGGTAVVTLPDFMVNGADDLTVWIDSNQGVPEWDEDNNFATANVSNRPLINETDAITENGDQHQFIELFDGGGGTTALDDFTVVLYDGATGVSYRTIDLAGQSTNADGYFVIGTSTVPRVDLVLADGFLQSGEDAVAIHELPSTGFPDGTAATTDSLIDAVVHGSGQGDGAALATALAFVGDPLDESAAGHAVGHSLQRLPNGGGSPRTAASFSTLSPTPGLENTLPLAPEDLYLTSASDTGESGDHITRVATPTIRGTARAGSLVSLSVDGGPPVASGFADAYGIWSIKTSSLTEGTRSITATADGGDPSAPLLIEIDLTAPAPPSLPDLVAASDSGVSNADNITTESNPTFSGTAEADALVSLNRISFYFDGVIGRGNAEGGSWRITNLGAIEGTYQVRATATDAAGNVSMPSPLLSLTVDRTSPAAPTALDLAAASDLGRSATDDLTNVTTPTITGSAENLASVTLSDGNNEVGTANSDGSWSLVTSTLPEGSRSLTATATDLAGNTSVPSAALAVAIDTTAPGTPSIPDLTVASDSGVSNTDDITSDNTPEFSGTAEAGADVNIFDGVTAAGAARSNGSWSATVSALADGVHNITAAATDAAGNISPASGARSITIDTGAPAPPSLPDLLTDSGVSANDDLTNVNTPTFSGTSENGAAIALFSGTTQIASGSSSGTWNLTSSTLGDAVHSISATATDVAGNVSPRGAALPVTIDTTAPTLAFGKSPGQDDPAANGPIAFTATFNESVDGFESDDITVGGSAADSASVGGGPAVYSVSVTTLPGEGTVTASVGAGVATDLAGNPSSAPVLGDTLVVLDVHSADNPSELTFSNGSASIQGWLEPGDLDVFTFTLTKPQIVTAQTSGSVDTRGSLHNSTDTLLNDPDADSDALDGHNFQISEVLPPGVYTVVVASEGSAQTGAYTLSIFLEDIPVLINEVDADTGDDHDLEFVELWDGGEGETPLDGYVLVFYRGDTQQTYLAVDLDGLATDIDGFFLIGNVAVTGIDAELPADSIRDGRDAVALYFGDADDFPDETPLTTTDLLDAVVCLPEGGAEGPELAGLLLTDEKQLDESENGFRDGQSLQRLPDGEGGPRVTSHFLAAAPTPGASNELPPAPGTPDLLPGSDSGTSDNDDLTNVVRPSFSGTGRPGSVILVDSDQNALVGTAFTLPDGTWTLVETDLDLSEGTHQISASTSAAATHSTGEASAPLTIEIDITAPDAPTTPDLLTSSDSGISGDDDVTSDNTPTLSGDAEVDSTIALFSGTDEIGTGTSTGQWIITASLLPDAVHSLAAESTDPAGNTSARSGVLEVTVDTQNPAVTVDQGPTQSDPARAGSVSFSANFTEPVFGFGPEDVITSGIAGTVGVGGGPSEYSITVATTADEGFVTAEVLAAGATDRAGNPNTASGSTDNHVALDRDDAPGGSPATLPTTGGTGSIPAYLHEGDTDTFVFTLDRPRVTTLYTTGQTDTVGELKDDAERVRNDPAADDDAGDGENFRTSVPLPAGTYTITVYSTGTGDYELLIEATELPFIQPDLTVNSKGRKIYGSPAGQTVSKKSRKMRPMNFDFTLINDAAIVDEFSVRSSRESRYFETRHKNSSGENITASLKTGTYRTSLIDASGTAIAFSTRIEPKAKRLKKRTAGVHSGYRGKSYRCSITATSITLPERQDSVSAKVKSKRIINMRDDEGLKPPKF